MSGKGRIVFHLFADNKAMLVPGTHLLKFPVFLLTSACSDFHLICPWLFEQQLVTLISDKLSS